MTLLYLKIQRQESRTLNDSAAGGRTLTVTLYRHAFGGKNYETPSMSAMPLIRFELEIPPEYKPKAFSLEAPHSSFSIRQGTYLFKLRLFSKAQKI